MYYVKEQIVHQHERLHLLKQNHFVFAFSLPLCVCVCVSMCVWVCEHSQVVGLLQLCPCLKYWGFSTTGIRLIPMTTASGPASSVHGVMMPWFT